MLLYANFGRLTLLLSLCHIRSERHEETVEEPDPDYVGIQEIIEAAPLSLLQEVLDAISLDEMIKEMLRQRFLTGKQ